MESKQLWVVAGVLKPTGTWVLLDKEGMANAIKDCERTSLDEGSKALWRE